MQVNEEELQSVEARLRTINQGAQIRRASKASVDVNFVMGLNMQDTQSVVREVTACAGGGAGMLVSGHLRSSSARLPFAADLQAVLVCLHVRLADASS